MRCIKLIHSWSRWRSFCAAAPTLDSARSSLFRCACDKDFWADISLALASRELSFSSISGEISIPKDFNSLMLAMILVSSAVRDGSSAFSCLAGGLGRSGGGGIGKTLADPEGILTPLRRACGVDMIHGALCGCMVQPLASSVSSSGVIFAFSVADACGSWLFLRGRLLDLRLGGAHTSCQWRPHALRSLFFCELGMPHAWQCHVIVIFLRIKGGTSWIFQVWWPWRHCTALRSFRLVRFPIPGSARCVTLCKKLLARCLFFLSSRCQLGSFAVAPITMIKAKVESANK